MKTCNRLRECGFHSIRMIEVRQRPFDGRKHLFESVDLGLGEWQRISPLTTATNDSVGKDNLDEEVIVGGSEEKRTEIEKEKEKEEEKEDSLHNTNFSGKRLLAEALIENNSNKKSKLEDSSDEIDSSRRSKKIEIDIETDEEKISRELRELREINYSERMASKYVIPTMPVKEVLIARPLSSMKGHTAFLTFAVRPPLTVAPIAK